MRIDLLTLFPAMFSGFFSESILKRAQDKHLLEIHLHDIRDYTTDKHRRVDDYPYSGEAGMLMKIEPIAACIERLQQERTYDEVIFLTPDGERLHQSMANQLSMLKNVILLCGHYKGIDERIRELFITREISIGDYVLSGGELPAAVLVDAMARLIPGVLNDESSALSDSYQYELLSPPVYTRPYDYKGHKVPDILLSGNEKEIKEWKLQKAIEKTRKKRPDLLQNYDAES
ncbi:MAG: tRNA (guanosine(37)-N1)-methyltransferase TrmD [Bacteroidales bacterium]|jgi:tRNA (guanine37-N1)-methyltransferase|nr:tRNA (guanosine(37)-N1)-methyltransferase TrmD [Bacteroidales bacterium]MDD2687111.1 tRNA (guanosine(37)-N1)-methyltransferase TrmD [Bacteroidales bacterium]MDD3330539.1 tRNA (guanosine(37)-N1)-methyltransferase TrmD [Bacteroidales bacterium]MDD3691807.1 tRNA (guanosine(37)-N1)-methyltransferase TrmD [Bacteroidales bacterium]MDD4044755.1 tRNA (guanosine(37)-N1)-methyltransferase TrmD [Bacteroidales bacterium]